MRDAQAGRRAGHDDARDERIHEFRRVACVSAGDDDGGRRLFGSCGSRVLPRSRTCAVANARRASRFGSVGATCCPASAFMG